MTVIVAFSPMVIFLALALIVKFFLLGSGAGLTVILTRVDVGLYCSSPAYVTLAVVVLVKPVIIIVALPFLIGAVCVLPFTLTLILPVAFSKPVTIIFASSPIIITLELALRIKFSRIRIGLLSEWSSSLK